MYPRKGRGEGKNANPSSGRESGKDRKSVRMDRMVRKDEKRMEKEMIVLAGKDETGAYRPVLRFLLPFPSLFLFFCFSSLLRNSKKDSICPRPIRESIIKYGKLGQFFEPEDYNFKH